jgi:hypothetical protein
MFFFVATISYSPSAIYWVSTSWPQLFFIIVGVKWYLIVVSVCLMVKMLRSLTFCISSLRY